MSYYVPSVQIAQEFQEISATATTPLASLIIGVASPQPGDTDAFGNPLQVQVGVYTNQTGSTPAVPLYVRASLNSSSAYYYTGGSSSAQSAANFATINPATGYGPVGSVTSANQVAQLLGTPCQANPLALGVYNAALNSNGAPVYYIALADDSITNIAKTWTGALALADKSGQYYGFVPVFSSTFLAADTNNTNRNQVHSLFEGDISTMSSQQKAKWRVAWFSTPVISGFNVPGLDGSDNYIASLPVSVTNWNSGVAPASADVNTGPRRFHNVFPGSYTIPVAASNATANLTIATGAIYSVTLTNAGTGYVDAPAVSFTGGGGTGATAVAFIEGGSITQLLITNGGSGYTSAPTVVFTPVTGDTTGAGATATVLVTTSSQYTIQRINILTNGAGYTSTPTASYTVSGGGTTTGTNTSPTLIMGNGLVLGAGTLSATVVNTAVTNAYYSTSPTSATISIGTVTSVGVVGSVFDGCFLAAAEAGLRSGSVPHQSLTNTQVILNGTAQLPDVVSTYSSNVLDWLAQNGVWIVTQDTLGGVTYNRHQITAAGISNLNYMEDSITANVDSISYGLQAALAPYVGIYNISPAALLKVRAAVDNVLSYYATGTFTERAGNQLIGYTINSITQNATYKDRVDINITLQVPYPMNYINVTLSI